MRAPLTLLSLGLWASSTALAADWYVDAHHPLCGTGHGTPERPFCRIVDAQRAARDGDTIYIAAGTYAENLILDKDLRLVGARGPEPTRIDGSYLGRVIDVPVPRIVVLEDLHLVRGYANRGAGVRGLGATLHLVRTRVAEQLFGNPLFGGNGGGIQVQGGALRLDDCELRDNLDSLGPYDTGSGISAYLAAVEIIGCSFTGNRSVGPCIEVSSGSLLVRRSTIAGNRGGGLSLHGGALTIEGSIVWGNAGTALQHSSPTPPSVRWSTIEGGWPGPGNLSADPQLEDLATGDLRLRAGSPCIDADDPQLAPAGTDRVDAPRFLDGDGDGCMTRDQGAEERARVRLRATGQLLAGTSFTLDAQGPSGWLAALFYGARPGELWLPPHGAFLLDPAAPTLLVTTAPLPFSRSFAVPLETPPWALALFQVVAIEPALLASECSNRVALTTR